MSGTRRTQREAVGRRGPRSAAVVVAAVLGLVAPSSVSTSVAGSSTAAGGADVTTAAICDPHAEGHSTARVDRSHADAHDPNSVTRAEAAQMDRELQEAVDELSDQGTLNRSGALSGRGGKKTFTVRTHIHVITSKSGEGRVSREQLRAQMRVLNDAYAGSGSSARTPFRFKTVSVDYTRNDDWYDWSSPSVDPSDNAEAKSALHRGGYADLNIYVANLQDGLLGYATFPEGQLELDGLVLLNESLPGGSAAPYNEGDTATHEVGHWLGLFHTFENGCEPPGDYVPDTPYQLNDVNVFSCDESLDTCRRPGSDPVHNYMSYGDDQCLDRFSRGQSIRQIWTWLAFRVGR